MLVCARLRHVAGNPVGQQEIHEHEALEAALDDASIAELTSFSRSRK